MSDRVSPGSIPACARSFFRSAKGCHDRQEFQGEFFNGSMAQCERSGEWPEEVRYFDAVLMRFFGAVFIGAVRETAFG